MNPFKFKYKVGNLFTDQKKHMDKECKRCKKIKPISEYGPNNNLSECESCRTYRVESKNRTLIERYKKGLIKCIKCKEIKNKKEFELSKIGGCIIPHTQICKPCSELTTQKRLKQKIKKITDKWLGYENEIIKVVEYVGYYSKSTNSDPYPRFWFKYRCKWCGNEEIVSPHQLSRVKSCYLCRCSFKIDENLKKCSSCDEWYPNTKKYFKFYKSLKSRMGGSHYYCHSCLSKKNKTLRKKRSLSGKESEYRKSIQSRTNQRRRERYITDPDFKMRLTIRNHLNRVTKIRKTDEHTEDLLGCTWEELRIHIEGQFLPDMNWDNHGEVWSYDHFVPLAFAKGNKKLLRMLSKYWNLGPVYSNENNTKNCQVPYITTPSEEINKLIFDLYENKNELKFLPVDFKI